MSTRWCVFQTHISLFIDFKKPPTLVAKSSPPPFSHTMGSFHFQQTLLGLYWVSLFLDPGSFLFSFLVVSLHTNGDSGLPSKQLPATFQIHSHGSPSPSSRCLGSPMIRYALQLRAICLLSEEPDKTLIYLFTSNLTIIQRHMLLENIITKDRERNSVWGRKCEMGAFQWTKSVASWPPLPSSVALGLCPWYFCVKWTHLMSHSVDMLYYWYSNLQPCLLYFLVLLHHNYCSRATGPIEFCY